MVTLRSDRKLAAVPAESTPSRGRKAAGTLRADRSVTPDRGSQDSTLRRSQRVRDRQSLLGVIPEDTADSAASPANASTGPQEPDSPQPARASVEIDTAAQPEVEVIQADTESAGADESMAELATPASDHPSEQSSDQQLSSDDANSEAETEASDSDDTDELLAQLSQSMWASLRPETHAQQSQEPPSTSGRGDQELNNDHSHAPSTRLHHAAGGDEDEMHWSPVTGLPEPLSAAACKASNRPDRKAHLLEKQFMLPPRDTRPLLRQQRKLAPETAGKQWFDLPAPQVTDEVKRDLKLLQLRGTFDPKRFYKSSDHKKALPKFFQIGTVVESAADFYSGRLTNNERKATITEELLADPELSQVRKRRFNKLQDEKHYWAKQRGRKTDLPRFKKNDRSKAKRMSR